MRSREVSAAVPHTDNICSPLAELKVNGTVRLEKPVSGTGCGADTGGFILSPADRGVENGTVIVTCILLWMNVNADPDKKRLYTHRGPFLLQFQMLLVPLLAYDKGVAVGKPHVVGGVLHVTMLRGEVAVHDDGTGVLPPKDRV